ncbi:MAG: serine/threonine protein kinase [Burkholderiaceae bacterium]|nr:serine/threonine protein kinase [Burkholderiaceae bacterium]
MNRLEPGAVIDSFTLGEQLYAGKMARIFSVTYADGRHSPFPMVMKVPKLSQGDGGENITSFEVELQLFEAISGPFMPQFVAAGGLEIQTPYLVIEYIQGQTLEEWLTKLQEENDQIQLTNICKIFEKIAHAIHGMHEQNACHLDLKPANILITTDSRVLLLDFGLSFHGDYPDLLAEEFRSAVGSPAWIAPEQVVGIRGDPRSDLFAIGVMLYEAVTGELPFGAPQSSSGLRSRLWMDPIPPRAINRSLPKWIQEIIFKCLQVRAEDRYASAALLALDLRNPETLTITGFGDKLSGTGLFERLKRFIWSAGIEYKPSPLPKKTIKEIPIVMVAFPDRVVTDSVLWGLERLATLALGNRPGARLAVVTVLRSSAVSGTKHESSEVTMHRTYLNSMQRWARGVNTEGHQISFHVIDSDDIAGSLLRFSNENFVDLIIVGAHTKNRGALEILPNVPMRVANEAQCTVTLVKERLPFHHLQNLI